MTKIDFLLSYTYNFGMIFKKLTKKLLYTPSQQELLIYGEKKTIQAVVRLTSQNYLQVEYWKVRFTDDSYMLLVLQDEEVYYSNSYIFESKEIADEQIGNDETIELNGKEYELGNKDDYQYVLELVYGSPTDIEGECRFSDYIPVNGDKEFLSLGWLARTGKRADIHCTLIDLSCISSV